MSDIKKPTRNVSGVGAINPLYHINQPSTNTAPVGGDSSGKQSTNQSALERQIRWILEFITANYTPNSEVQDLVATSMADAADEASKAAINQLTMGGEWIPASEVMKLRLENAAKLANLDQKITHLEADVAERELVARLNERQELALDLYQGHTFSDNTDFRVKFNKFIKNNNRRIAELTKDQL